MLWRLSAVLRLGCPLSPKAQRTLCPKAIGGVRSGILQAHWQEYPVTNPDETTLSQSSKASWNLCSSTSEYGRGVFSQQAIRFSYILLQRGYSPESFYRFLSTQFLLLESERSLSPQGWLPSGLLCYGCGKTTASSHKKSLSQTITQERLDLLFNQTEKNNAYLIAAPRKAPESGYCITLVIPILWKCIF